MTLDRRTNPFEELYVTETIPSQDFVRLFSDYLVPHALQLFQPGNVVLVGVQGSGKSMLLSLLKPSIRIAYAQAGVDFPLPDSHRQFVGAGINLRRSRATDFGQRRLVGEDETELEHLALYFGDFLNYWIVEDLLKTLDAFASAAGGRIAKDLGLKAEPNALNAFAKTLCEDPCWFGALEQVRSYEALKQALQARIGSYFRFLNFNSDSLPPPVKASKSSVGAPISATSKLLHDFAILPRKVKVFVQIDQYEEMAYLGHLKPQIAGAFRQVVNKALGMRDGNVSYRVGVRGWAWRDELTIFGSQGKLERDREYSELNLDEMLRRKENVHTFIFPGFAEDVLRRRLTFAGYDISSIEGTLIGHVFGKSESAENRAEHYVRRNSGCQPDRIIKAAGLKPVWVEFLLALAKDNPLDARLAEAWIRQRKETVEPELPSSSVAQKEAPWYRQYWRKERRELALMQLAASCQQRMVWAGERDILALSGGNILVFVSLCRQIWSAHIRAEREVSQSIPGRAFSVPTIRPLIQSIGIEEASLHWYRKVPEQPGGDDRQRFLSVVGGLFQRELLSDRAMSYPGHNGFSVTVAEVNADPLVLRFLSQAVDYADLFEASHTTKGKDRKQRVKFYLKPILSPHFRIPVGHVKEPMYVTVQAVREWLNDAEAIVLPREKSAKPNADQIRLAL